MCRRGNENDTVGEVQCCAFGGMMAIFSLIFLGLLFCVSGIPASLSWCWNTGDVVAFVSHRGPLYIWTISGADSGVVVHKDAHSFLADICLFRWHPKKKGKVVFGHTDGSLSIFQPGMDLCCEAVVAFR